MPDVAFFCTSCGHESGKWLGQCPGCGEWNSFAEQLTPPKAVKATSRILARALQRYGCHLQTCADRLDAFNGVQNTYLSIFLALGGVALVLNNILSRSSLAVQLE